METQNKVASYMIGAIKSEVLNSTIPSYITQTIQSGLLLRLLEGALANNTRDNQTTIQIGNTAFKDVLSYENAFVQKGINRQTQEPTSDDYVKPFGFALKVTEAKTESILSKEYFFKSKPIETMMVQRTLSSDLNLQAIKETYSKVLITRLLFHEGALYVTAVAGSYTDPFSQKVHQNYGLQVSSAY